MSSWSLSAWAWAALALENATAGCAAETFGVWLHLVQANAAQDQLLRAGARAIAEDEARHAALAFELLDWFAQRSSPEQNARVRTALSRHWLLMPDSVRLEDSIAGRLGIPDREQRVRGLSRMTSALMGAAAAA